MAKIRSHLRAAPIKEALIDFRISPRSDCVLQQIQRIADLLPGYRQQGLIYQIETTLNLSNDSETESKKTLATGVRFQSADESFVAQFGIGGFTLSRLPPYKTWGNLVEEALRLWKIYLEVAKPELVTRVATRFINDLQLPMLEGEHFEDYLTASPKIPPGLSQAVLEFLQRVVIGEPTTQCLANVIQVLQEGPRQGKVPVILDIDVYKAIEFVPSDHHLWETLEALRIFKNTIFFESLQEKAVELYV
jgi:uncharacterized protein (TIGR04255 family)